MRVSKLFLFIIALLSICSCSKKGISGLYEYQVGDPTKSAYRDGNFHVNGGLVLNKDSTFQYYRNSQLTGISSSFRRGQGQYELKGDTLFLHYQGYPDTYKKELDSLENEAIQQSILKNERTLNSSNEISTIDLDVSSIVGISDTMPIVFANVILDNIKDYDSRKYHTTDIDGKLRIEALKTDFPLKIKIEHIGYVPVFLTVDDSEYNYKYHVLMTDWEQQTNHLSLGNWIYGTWTVRYHHDQISMNGNTWVRYTKRKRKR